ncbi:hypothetical protein NOK12_16550 [Nocardioides sp. OK12]|uniref:hypothetical protein n=1 Tax=Nocardioides sp. OK12 TaxID=2758661 RepID=UPI0021C2AD00|nr:hypothetical protein [Nocardioides sp. OK12]GHJ59137.1 hypothetical protein NOK12_16550 [Nocardioides sp. OK12]
MALPPLATVDDLAAWVGREIPSADPRAGAVLSHASTRVRTYAGLTWTDETGALVADVPDVVRDVTVRVAARAWSNREELDSVTLDDGTKRWGTTRGLVLTDEDRADLAQFRGTTAPAGFGVVRTTRGDDLGDDTIYVPTAPAPAGYPFPWYSANDPFIA